MMSIFSQSYLASLPAEELRQLRATHLSLGIHPQTRDEFFVSDTARESSIYMIGTPGSGKSSAMKSYIIQDATRGYTSGYVKKAVIVFDPNEDLANQLMAELPAECISRVRILDMRDESHPFSVNVFADAGILKTDAARSAAVERIMYIFEVLWPEVMAQQNLPMLLRMATITFLDNPGTTLPDMIRFFRDDAYRAQLVANTLPDVRDNIAYDYDRLTEKERRTRVAPLMNRLQSLFVGRTQIRNILGQAHSSMDFRKAIENREILLIKLPMKTQKQDARLVGMILMTLISGAVFSFVDTPREERPQYSLFVDEFQNLAASTFEVLFTEGRKYGLQMLVGHQNRDQLYGSLQKSTLNARVTICFHTTTDDAPEMGKQFPAQDNGTFEPSTRATKDLLTYATEFPPAVREFIEVYLRKLPKSGDVVVKINPGLLDTMFFDQTKAYKVKRTNPTSYLDNLFYEVMKTRSPHHQLPPEAIEGLATGGDGFHSAIKWWNTGCLQWDVSDFPAHLVTRLTDGSLAWRRRVEGPKEQLLHCLFHLRMTMHYLAEHPVGKQVAGKGNNVADMLTQLPPRMAFVKSDKTVGVIYTHTTPRPLTGDELERRVSFIREQTRAQYCQPWRVVEQADHPITVHTTLEGEIHLRRLNPTSPVSRWEDEDV